MATFPLRHTIVPGTDNVHAEQQLQEHALNPVCSGAEHNVIGTPTAPKTYLKMQERKSGTSY